MSILSPALLGAVGLVMVAASIGHLRSPEELRRGLRAHGIVPARLHDPLSRALGLLEGLLGVAALGAATTGPSRAVSLAIGVPLTGLCLALAWYLARVLRNTAGQVVPCACGLGQAPANRSAVLRAGLLAAMSLIGAVTAAGWSIAAAPVEETVVALAAALVLALATALLPAARAVPELAIRGGHR